MAKKNEIAKVDTTTIQPVEQIESLILTIRDKQVILDRDLARLYGVETKRLNEQVKRNIERFPEDFMFQLSKEEAESSRSQFVMLNADGDELKSQFATSNEGSSKSQSVMLNGRGHNIKQLAKLRRTTSSRDFLKDCPVGIKAVLTQKGIISNHLRLPLVPASKDLQSHISSALQM